MKPSNGNLLNDGHDNGMKGGLSVKNMYSSVIYYGRKHSILELIQHVDKSSLLTG